jgi:hypothetical protein
MDGFSAFFIIIILIGLAIGTLICALLHGLGFTVFGYSEIRPSFGRRCLMSLVAAVINSVFGYLVGTLTGMSILTAGIAGGITAGYITLVVFYVVIAHLSFSAVTYLMFDAKGNLEVALKSPIIMTAVFLVLNLLPIFFLPPGL